MTFRQRAQFWRFALKQSLGRILLSSAVVVLVLLILYIAGLDWWGYAEPLVTLLTLAVAFFIGYQQMREEWVEDHLPKRLTAHYYYGEKEIMRCENARLAGEADVRALTQQIGWQMNHVKDQLKFAAPDIKVSPPQVSGDGGYVHYVAEINLIDLPSTLSPKKRRVWREPFIQGGTYSFRDEELD